MNIEWLEDKLDQRSQSPLFARLASEYLAIGRVSEAKDLCTSGLERYPFYATAHIINAKCLAAQGNYDEAIALLTQARAFLPDQRVVDGLIAHWQEFLQPTPDEPITQLQPETPPQVEEFVPEQSIVTTDTEPPVIEEQPASDAEAFVASEAVPPDSPEEAESELLVPAETDTIIETAEPFTDAIEPVVDSPVPVETIEQPSDIITEEPTPVIDEPVEFTPPEPEAIISTEPIVESPVSEIIAEEVIPTIEEQIEVVPPVETEVLPPEPVVDTAPLPEVEEDETTAITEPAQQEIEQPVIAEETAPTVVEEFVPPEPPAPAIEEPPVVEPTALVEPPPVAVQEEPAGTNGDNWRIVTRTLAEIFAAQGAYDEAIVTYRLLKEQRPEMSGEIEQRILELEAKAQIRS